MIFQQQSWHNRPHLLRWGLRWQVLQYKQSHQLPPAPLDFQDVNEWLKRQLLHEHLTIFPLSEKLSYEHFYRNHLNLKIL